MMDRIRTAFFLTNLTETTLTPNYRSTKLVAQQPAKANGLIPKVVIQPHRHAPIPLDSVILKPCETGIHGCAVTRFIRPCPVGLGIDRPSTPYCASHCQSVRPSIDAIVPKAPHVIPQGPSLSDIMAQTQFVRTAPPPILRRWARPNDSKQLTCVRWLFHPRHST